MTTEKFRVTGMSCAACRANVEKSVNRVSGVSAVACDLLSGRMTATYDESVCAADDIIAAVTAAGYGAEHDAARDKKSGYRAEWERRRSDSRAARRTLSKRLIASVALLVPLMYIAMGHMVGLPLPRILDAAVHPAINALTQFIIAIAVAAINGRFYVSGVRALLHGGPNMDTLVAAGSAASLIYGAFVLYMMLYAAETGDAAMAAHYSHELYFESAAMILTLVTVGKYLEARSKAKTSDALDKLVDLAPKTAVVLRGGTETVIPADDVAVGDIVVIRPGQSIPVDGVVTDGRGYVDQSAITGESIPVERTEGDGVISATMNKNGVMHIRATRVGDDTTLSQIVRLVDDAASSRAPIARLADRVSGVFVPIVMGIAVVTFAVWMIAGAGFEFALSCGITVLVISCPCALGLATPVAIMAGTGKAAEQGILIRSAQSLEMLASVDTVVLDKTGTVTSGHPSVTDVYAAPGGMSGDELTALAAAAETGSEHPLAEAVVEYARRRGIDIPQATDFDMRAGRGVSAVAAGRSVIAGNRAFMEESGVPMDTDSATAILARAETYAGAGGTPLLFAADGECVGVIAVSDTVREQSREAICTFKKLGLCVVMLTGDNASAARSIATQTGIDTVFAGLLPADKEAQIRRLQEEGHRVAMVGDGINDAPALTRADVGIAIGAGADIAVESADVVLMKDSLFDAAAAVELSRAVVRNIRENLFWAFFYNVLGIPLAAGALYPALGIRLSPMIGAAAMSLSSLFVVGNALRLRLFGRAKDGTKKAKGVKMTMTVLEIEGMMCDHCRARVEQALTAVAGAENVRVDVKSGTAEVGGSAAPEALGAAVTAAGYRVVSVNKEK